MPSLGVRHLWKPVALNPLLYRVNELVKELQSQFGRAFGVDIPVSETSPHSSFMDTFLTDPPCMRCRVELTCASTSLAPDGKRYCRNWANMISEKPLTLGDFFNRTLEPQEMYARMESTEGRCDGIAIARGSIPSDQAGVLDKRRWIVFQGQSVGIGFGLDFDEFTFRPLLLTNDEYFRLRPTEDSSQ
jgi:hypothetical protein